jgi:6-pyruvoyltetrahydropterin 2'-reductase
MPKEKRITPDFSFFAHNHKAFFKFVVASWDDVLEIHRDYVTPFNLEPARIWLMPCADNEQTLRVLAPQVAQWALRVGWNYSDRLQVRIWNRATGV